MSLLIIAGFSLAVMLAAIWGSAHVFGVWAFVLLVHGMLVYWFGESLQQLSLIVGVLAVSLALIGKREFSARLLPACLIVGFLLAVMLSFLVTWGDESTLAKVITYVKPLAVCFLLTGLVKSDRELYVIATYVLAAAAIGSLFNVYQQVTGTQVNANEWNSALSRTASLRADPNDTAMLLLSALPLAYMKVMNSSGFWRSSWLALSGLIVVGVVLTGSRGGFVVLAIIVIALLVHRPNAVRGKIIGMPSAPKLVTVALLALVGIALAPDYYWDRMGTLVSGKEIGQSESLYNRKLLLDRGIEAWMDNPVVGVGPGQYHQAVHGRDMLSAGETGNKVVAHNMYLEFLVEFGLVGFFIFMAIGSVAVTRLFRFDMANRSERHLRSVGYGYALGLLAMLVMGLTLSQGYNPVLWFYLGLGLALERVKAATPSTLSPVTTVAPVKFNFQ